jgi:hypothetical protein
MALSLCVCAIAWPVLAPAQTGGAQSAPDLSGAWDRSGELVETFEKIPGDPGPGPLLVDPLHPHEQSGYDSAGPLRGGGAPWAAKLDNPILKPETLAKLRPITEAEIEGIPHVKNEGHCEPSGVPGVLNVRGAIQLLQAPDQVTIINPRDYQTRHVYLNVAHSKNLPHTWYGESVGHYEGDTLVVDTIGQNAKTMIDRFGTTHSDKIHVVERYRVAPNRRSMEVQFTVDDPGAFTMPWSARARYAAKPVDTSESVCAENNRAIGQVLTYPSASKADF